MVAALEFVTSWITPTSLFLFLNLVIGTIAITSRFSHTTSHPHPQPPPSHLARSPSLLDRLKSGDFSFYKFPPPETNTEPDTSTRLERAPSLLERVKSFTMSSYLNRADSEPEAVSVPDSGPGSEVLGSDHHVTRSVSEPRGNQVIREKIMKKSASEKEVVEVEKEEIMEEVEKRRPATMRLEKTVSFGDEGVDEKADDFINRFKQQLKLQRLDSLLRYRDMLRGKQQT